MKRPINFCNYTKAKFDLISGSPPKEYGIKLYDYALTIDWEWDKLSNESKDEKYWLYMHGKWSNKHKLDFLKKN